MGGSGGRVGLCGPNITNNARPRVAGHGDRLEGLAQGLQARMDVWMHLWIVCMYVYIYIYVVVMYIYIYIHI